MKKLILLSLLACGILAGCDEFLGESNDKSLISFVYSDSSMDNITRGSQTNLASLAQFGVSCAICSSSDTYANVGCGSFFFDIPVDAATGHTDYYWPGSRYKLSFFAYTPIDNPNLVISSDKNDNGKPIYSYSVPTDLSMMADFMTCDILDHVGTSQTAVPLSFSHRLTDVRFSVYNQQNNALTVKSISIYGVKYEGTFQDDLWMLSGAANSSSSHPFTLLPNSVIASESTVDITGTADHFILLPQTVAAGTDFIVVKTIEDGEERTYTHTLDDDYILSMGKSVTFKLTLGNGQLIVDSSSDIKEWEPYVFTLTVTAPNDYTYSGGSDTYSITSYRSNTANTEHEAANWTATFSEDGGATFSATKPSWLTVFTDAGDGNADMSASNYTATVDAQMYSSGSEPATTTLRNATEVSDYDLSLHTVSGAVCAMTTANCYMVHASGTYRLPLVYGNAIKDGADNTVAYMPGSVNNGIANFINHNDKGISAPWITKSGSGVNGGMDITVDGAQLIWQDVDGLTTEYAIDGDYLTFSVPKATIAEGNAVIAVKSGSTIVWSWHIWVTPETFASTTDIDTGSHIYTVTPVNVGWIGTGNISWTKYAERSCIVKITQAGGLEETFTINQTPSMIVTASKLGNSPYYQWGRKDPFVPSADNSGNTDKTVYVGDGVPSAGYVYEASMSATIGTNIQNPWKHYYSYSTRGPVSSTYYNMWDAQQSGTENISTATKKTIYDPCPPGYCVPTGNLFYFMDYTGGSNEEYGTWDSTNNGRTWIYGGAELFFPAAGYRYDNSADLNNVGSYGNYWSASVQTAAKSSSLYLTSKRWVWNSNYRSCGIPVRAVAEE